MAVSPGFLSEHEVRSTYALVSHSTLWRWCRIGIFPKPIRCGPRRIFWRRADVEAWAAALPTAPAYRGEVSR